MITVDVAFAVVSGMHARASLTPSSAYARPFVLMNPAYLSDRSEPTEIKNLRVTVIGESQ